MPIKNNFNEIFARLKSIFQPYAKKMDPASDTESYYLLNTRYIMKNKQPLCFGGVRRGKNYVSFYLMSVYACPELLQSMSPELKNRCKAKRGLTFKKAVKNLFKGWATLPKAAP